MLRAAGWNEGRAGISFTGGGVCSLNGVLGGDATGRGGGSGGLDSEGIDSTSPSNKLRNRSSHCCCFSLKFLRRGDVASSSLFSSSAAACRDLRRFPIHSAAVANSESRMRKKIGLSNTRIVIHFDGLFVSLNSGSDSNSQTNAFTASRRVACPSTFSRQNTL